MLLQGMYQKSANSDLYATQVGVRTEVVLRIQDAGNVGPSQRAQSA